MARVLALKDMVSVPHFIGSFPWLWALLS